MGILYLFKQAATFSLAVPFMSIRLDQAATFSVAGHELQRSFFSPIRYKQTMLYVSCACFASLNKRLQLFKHSIRTYRSIIGITWVCISKHARVHTHTRTHARMHACTHTHTHTHTHTPALSAAASASKASSTRLLSPSGRP